MFFYSILTPKALGGGQRETPYAPDFFVDLNLDQIINAITAHKQEYNLKPFFYNHVSDLDTIQYRQEVARDLENAALMEIIQAFAEKMVVVRRYLALIDTLYFQRHKQGWFLEAVVTYCEAVQYMVQELSGVDLQSRGLLAFREYLASYARSPKFTYLRDETQKLKTELSTITYCILIKNRTFKVRKYLSEPDYSLEIEEIFKKFQQGAVRNYLVDMPAASGMSHVEAQILDFVAELYPEIFSHLEKYCESNVGFLEDTIRVFDREIQFYVSYLEYIAVVKQAGLKFSYPKITQRSKTVYDYEGYDLALAYKRVSEKSSVVWNDFALKDKERIIVVSGPNQGGKTTFARTFGQLHFLANLGLPVPGRKAQLFLFDRIFTHFEKEENMQNLRGKLHDELIRISRILSQATPSSIIILNEIFTSTSLMDAVYLSKSILEKIDQLDLLCVCVTFIDELSLYSEKTISMISTVVPDNPAIRTYKILRKPADGLAYAISIAEKYQVTYDCLLERIQS